MRRPTLPDLFEDRIGALEEAAPVTGARRSRTVTACTVTPALAAIHATRKPYASKVSIDRRDPSNLNRAPNSSALSSRNSAARTATVAPGGPSASTISVPTTTSPASYNPGLVSASGMSTGSGQPIEPRAPVRTDSSAVRAARARPASWPRAPTRAPSRPPRSLRSQPSGRARTSSSSSPRPLTPDLAAVADQPASTWACHSSSVTSQSSPRHASSTNPPRDTRLVRVGPGIHHTVGAP